MSTGKMLIFVSLALMASSAHSMWKSERFQNERQDLQNQIKAQTITQQSLETRKGTLERVVSLDETIVTRYQKSIDACREAASAMIDRDYTGAMIHAKDVGETEEDIAPLLNERQKLLQETNADLL